MFGIGLPELLTILVLATLVVGPEGMVKFAGQLGQLLAKFRRETEGVTKEFKEAFNLELLNPTGDSSAQPGGARPASATTRQWNLPSAGTAPTSATAPSDSAASEIADTVEAPATGEVPDGLPAVLAVPESVELPEVVAVDFSPEAEAVSLGIAEWVLEDERAEATLIGEPLWVDVGDGAVASDVVALEPVGVDGDSEQNGDQDRENAASEEVA